jgi:hypothetical protein
MTLPTVSNRDPLVLSDFSAVRVLLAAVYPKHLIVETGEILGVHHLGAGSYEDKILLQ